MNQNISIELRGHECTELLNYLYAFYSSDLGKYEEHAAIYAAWEFGKRNHDRLRQGTRQRFSFQHSEFWGIMAVLTEHNEAQTLMLRTNLRQQYQRWKFTHPHKIIQLNPKSHE